MRIIAGKAKGIKLTAPSGLNVRPTADRVKESVFNILQTYIQEATVLDIFSGTGNLGLEALSRGAKSGVFIDISPVSIETIKKNGAKAKLLENMKIYRLDSIRGLMKLAQNGDRFDLIFCDPPYNQGFVARVLEKVDSTNLLVADGFLVVEHSKHEELMDNLKNLILKRTEIYGETIISFFTVNR